MANLKQQKQEMSRRTHEYFTEDDVENVKKMVEEKTAAVYRKRRAIELRKISLLQEQRVKEINVEAEWIENTTTTELPDYVERSLMLGPNFNINEVSGFPYIETVANIEKYVQRNENADQIRSEVCNAMINHIHYHKQPRHSPNEWIEKDVNKSKRFLRDNPNLVITKADKGNKIVIMETQEYQCKMEELLSNEDTYKKLTTNPTNRILRSINNLLTEWHNKGYIDGSTQRKLKESSCHPPRIYGLPKIHKDNRTLRPVVSTIGSATYNIAKYLSDKLGNITGKTGSHVRNSFDFAEEITGFQTNEEEVLFSLDVVSLYTNVPVDFALECLEERWEEVEQHTNIDKTSFIDAVKLVLESTFFVYQGKVYGQTFGVPMGSPLSPVIANVVMEKLEQECRNKLEEEQISLRLYRRYVDDCMCVAKNEHIQKIVDTFNSFHDRLQFTVEVEMEGKIKFLDMMLERKENSISTTWLPKQSNGRYLDYTSHSPFQHKKNTAIALIDRAIKLTGVEKREDALKQATHILRINNYPLWFIQRIKSERVHKHYNSLQSNDCEHPVLKYVSAPYIPCLSEKLRKTSSLLQDHKTK
ncbi:uncharacterized protein LOC134205978 [Armigeres subalbatus]|uniref:uncharacterized protein LOC134205978 n=1 Tax=Armigeres subalbatus TaxID=124917 RepID=UPI002ED04BDA